MTQAIVAALGAVACRCPARGWATPGADGKRGDSRRDVRRDTVEQRTVVKERVGLAKEP
jgi:hypothetical protein